MNKSQLKKIIGCRSNLVNTETWYGNAYAVMRKAFLQLEYPKIWSKWEHQMLEPDRVITEDKKVNSILSLFENAKEIKIHDKHLYFRKTGIGYDIWIPLNEDGIAWVNHIYLEPVFDNKNYKLFYNEKSSNFFMTVNADKPERGDIVYAFMGLDN